MKEDIVDPLVLLEPEVFPGGENPLAGRDTGRRLRDALTDLLQGDLEETILYIDFSRVSVIDYSCADEVFGKLVPRLLADEFGLKFLCLTNVAASHLENIGAALEKRQVALAAMTRRGEWTCAGKLTPYLRETFDLVYRKRRLSSRELSQHFKLSLSTGSTRLINLFKQRLVGRQEKSSSRGSREFVYRSFARGFSFG